MCYSSFPHFNGLDSNIIKCIGQRAFSFYDYSWSINSNGESFIMHAVTLYTLMVTVIDIQINQVLLNFPAISLSSLIVCAEQHTENIFVV